jgi:flavin-binding protein dodecin
MAANSYAVSEIVGSSETGVDDAIRGAVASAAQGSPALEWFEVTEIRGHIVDQAVAHFQVTIKVGSRIDEGSP